MKKIIAVILLVATVLSMSLSLTSCAGNKSYFYADGIGLSKGVTNYFASYYKSYYMQVLASQGYNVEDTEAFWNTPYYGLTSTLGDYLKYYTEKYIKSVISASLMFDEISSLSYEDEVEIELAAGEVLRYYFGGLKSEFNAVTKENFGFNYGDFYKATELLYKAHVLEERLLAARPDEFSSYKDEFYNNYLKIEFLYIASDGFDEEEKTRLSEYQAAFSELCSKVSGGEATPEELKSYFDEIALAYSKKSECHYLYQSSSFTSQFLEKDSKIANAALGLYPESGSYVECESESFSGVCFMYSLPLDSGAYENSESEYFTDFISLASNSFATETTDKYNEAVSLGKRWEKINLIKIKYNYEYTPIFY